MYQASPPDRAQPLDLSTQQGRSRAQTLCPVFSCKDPKEKQPARGSRGRAGTRSCALVYPSQLAHARTRHQEPREVTYTGPVREPELSCLGLATLQGRTRAQTPCQSLIMRRSWEGLQGSETFLATKHRSGSW